ncbi:hypothetical protein [Curtobacterium sp. MCLR17_039]|uniref:hypothetical protein n=1 Tax=Curtobacterium sp. MCLR17_039 TaxID=2175624 RepID=UPI0011B4AECF|nr:hypothetical protein [Curtobacterium sp. MCLR17_039]
MKKSISMVMGAAFAAGLILAGAQTASAAGETPAPSTAGGVITVCAGESVNLNAEDGTVLPFEDQQALIAHAQFRCANPAAPASGAIVDGTDDLVAPSSSKAVVRASSSPTVTAHLTLTPGLARWLATAQHNTRAQKKLTCEYRVNGGAFSECGSASGTETHLSTRTNSICPVKGEHWEVEAFLHEGRVDYYDTASGISK